MNLQPKKSFAMVDYDKCRPNQCNPEKGVCAAVSACTHKVIKQLDGDFQPPVVFQDICMACWDCIEACPLDSIYMMHVS